MPDQFENMTQLETQPSVAVITGGASGVGAAVARLWIHGGGRVILLDRDAEAVSAQAAEFGDLHAAGFAVDVTDDARVTESLHRSAAVWGQIDVLINCAGIARPAAAATGSDPEWCELIDIHLSGSMRTCRAAYPYLAKSDRAAIVNISSIAASNGMPGRSSYCAAKSGIEGLTRALAVEWASDRIRVNAVAPGYVETPLTSALLERGALDLKPVLARTPMARLAGPDEIAEPVIFLASTSASYITGQTLAVDGGMSVDGNWY